MNDTLNLDYLKKSLRTYMWVYICECILVYTYVYLFMYEMVGHFLFTALTVNN